MATDAEIAWCAGFFDGEGHVGYKRSRPLPSGKVSPLLQATIPQKMDNVEVLEFFQATIGFGTIYGPYHVTTGEKRTLTSRFDLKYKTKEVEPLFQILRPYLKSKKTEDFIRALDGFKNHIPFITPDDVVRLAKNGCPKCKQKWNGMTCISCGYM